VAGTGTTLAYARDIGQVRDMLRTQGDLDVPVYPTVAEAVAALGTGTRAITAAGDEAT
jgi:hypothetical protein